MNQNFFIAILISFLISLAATPLVRLFFISRHWLEDPAEKQRKTGNATATSIIPRGGGIAVFISVLITSLLFLPVDKHLLGILFAAGITLAVGVWDDIKDISPKTRLFTNLLAALIVVGSGIGIAYISNPFGGIIDLSVFKINFNLLGGHSIWIVSDILAVIWIVSCMNIVGWSAGVDGQLPGFVAISAIYIGLIGLRFSQDSTQWPVIILAAAVAGSYLGFLPFNLFPAKIMPGYSGKSLAGFFLSLLAILSGAKLATVILLLGIPIIDAVFVIFKRIIQGRSPLSGGPDHLHHHLLKNGWSRNQIAVFYWLISFILGFISLYLNSSQKFYVFVGLVVIFIAFSLKAYRRI